MRFWLFLWDLASCHRLLPAVEASSNRGDPLSCQHAITSFSRKQQHTLSCKKVYTHIYCVLYVVTHSLLLPLLTRKMYRHRTLYKISWETLYTHKHTWSHTHTQKSWGRSFVIWGGIYSHALYTEGSDLRHSSENLCPNSCGLIRLCTGLEDNVVPRIMRGIQSITHLQSTLSVHICTCKPFSMCLCTSLSMFNGERFPAFTALAAAQLHVCVCVCAHAWVCACAHVLVCKGFWDGFAFSSLMAERLSCSFMHRKPMV